ncbi:MAG: FHA domain-containing protein [Chloroflexi bacterium]|nr:FHA domain-containing protein [Chloroflexota bacterium]
MRTERREEYFLQALDDIGQVVRELPLAGVVTIGRGSPDFAPDVVIPGECQSASRQHAVIELGGDRPVLTDNSRLGTIVNGRRIEHTSVELHHGDEVVFGLEASGWRVRFRVAGHQVTYPPDPLEMLTVSETPRKVYIGQLAVEEHLGGRAFHLLKFLAEHKGGWYPLSNLASVLWPDPDRSPYSAETALSHYKKAINDLLRPHLQGQDALQARPYSGYRMKPRLDDIPSGEEGRSRD